MSSVENQRTEKYSHRIDLQENNNFVRRSVEDPNMPISC